MTQNHHRQAMEEEAERFDSSSERTIYLQMMWWADKKGVIRRSQRDVAEDTLLHRITVAKNIQSLTEKGLIRKVRQGRYAIPARGYKDTENHNGNALLASILALSTDEKTVILSAEEESDGAGIDIMRRAVEEGYAERAGYTSDGSLMWRITA